MSYNFLIDSCAWIEYFSGSKIGLSIKEIIETDKIATSILVIAELSDKFIRENKSFQKELLFIQSKAAILPLNIDIVLYAAKIKKERRKNYPKFGLADAIIYSCAKNNNTILITKDNDYRGLEKVRIFSTKT